MDLFGDIVGAVINAFGVIGPTGCEEVLADGVAVEVYVNQTEGGDVKSGALDGFWHFEFAAQIGGRRERRFRVTQIAPRRTSGRAYNLRRRPFCRPDGAAGPVGAAPVCRAPGVASEHRVGFVAIVNHCQLRNQSRGSCRDRFDRRSDQVRSRRDLRSDIDQMRVTGCGGL